MATRTEPMSGSPSSFLVSACAAGGWSCFGLFRGRRGAGVCRVARVAPAFGLDQFGQPADLALDRFEAVPLEFEGVAVDALAGARDGGLDVVEPFFKPTAPTFENAHPHGGVGLREEREVH